ncbi:MAG: hypothetical protein JNK67_31585 [Alphaproteobacteria bacterium]|nr:hypothetical protein [Alphaproteobacteria bacterium]
MIDKSALQRRRRSPDELVRHPLPLEDAARHDAMAAELLHWWAQLAPPRAYPGWGHTALIQGMERLVLVAIVRRRRGRHLSLTLDRGAMGLGGGSIPIRTRCDALALFKEDCTDCALSGSPAYHAIGLPGGPPVCRRVILPFAAGDDVGERLVIGLESGPARWSNPGGVLN